MNSRLGSDLITHMSGSGGVLPFAVASSYDHLVERLEDVSISANCGVIEYSKPLSGRFKIGRPGLIQFEGFLHLKEWSFRRGSKQRIHILLHVQEEISSTNHVLLRSTVRVSYFLPTGAGTAELMQTVHFDYGPAQACHPRFHAQITSDSIILSDELKFDLDFDFRTAKSQNHWFNHARIPTCDMTFPSVLLCLAADHIGSPFFNDFFATVREYQARMPQPVFDALKESLSAERDHLRSSHWFSDIPQAIISPVQ